MVVTPAPTRRRGTVAASAAVLVLVLGVGAAFAYHSTPVVMWRIEREARAHLEEWTQAGATASFEPVHDGALLELSSVRVDGDRIVVRHEPPAVCGAGRAAVRVVESARAVVPLLVRRDISGGDCPAIRLPDEETVVELDRPLGDRVVLDPASGERVQPR